MKKSALCSTKPRSVSTGPPFSTVTSPARGGSWIFSAVGNDVELHQQVGKADCAAGWLTTMPIAPSDEWAHM